MKITAKSFDDAQIKTLKMGDIVKFSFCCEDDEYEKCRILLVLSDPGITKLMGTDCIKIRLHVYYITTELLRDDDETNTLFFYSVGGQLDQPIRLEPIAWI